METISKQEELLQELLKEYDDPADALKRGGLVDELKKRLIEKAMCAELDNLKKLMEYLVSEREKQSSQRDFFIEKNVKLKN